MILLSASSLSAQEIALKGGIAISKFETSGDVAFDDSFVSTSFGGHVRFRFGPIALQPELHLVSRGASVSDDEMKQRLRLDYMEVPLMLVVPVHVGAFEPYVFGGPMLALETRCRNIIEEEGLTTNFGCDDDTLENSFDRGVFDYGATVGAGISRRLGSGRILLEARNTWGLRNIYDGEGDIEVRNRTMLFSIGYAILPGSLD